MKKVGVCTTFLLLVVLASNVYAETTFSYSLVSDTLGTTLPLVGAGFHSDAAALQTVIDMRAAAAVQAASETGVTYKGATVSFDYIPVGGLDASQVVETLDRFISREVVTNPAIIAGDARVLAALQSSVNLRTSTSDNFVLVAETRDSSGKLIKTESAALTKEVTKKVLGLETGTGKTAPNFEKLREVTGKTADELASVSPALQNALQQNVIANAALGGSSGGAQGSTTIFLLDSSACG